MHGVKSQQIKPGSTTGSGNRDHRANSLSGLVARPKAATTTSRGVGVTGSFSVLIVDTSPAAGVRSNAMSVYVRLSVCLSVCPLSYIKDHSPNFTNFSVYVTCGRVSVLFDDNAIR